MFFSELYNGIFNVEDIFLLSFFKETNRVLKNNGLLSFSVRNDKGSMYKKGIAIAENIYDINDFQIRFFTKQDIKIFY